MARSIKFIEETTISAPKLPVCRSGRSWLLWLINSWYKDWLGRVRNVLQKLGRLPFLVEEERVNWEIIKTFPPIAARSSCFAYFIGKNPELIDFAFHSFSAASLVILRVDAQVKLRFSSPMALLSPSMVTGGFYCWMTAYNLLLFFLFFCIFYVKLF